EREDENEEYGLSNVQSTHSDFVKDFDSFGRSRNAITTIAGPSDGMIKGGEE
ncbi:MAG: hypothetical protein EZS28_039258, partial [Streblomastix strix]